MQINGSTRIVAVFGDPIAHTASPAMHNAAFAALGLNWVYVACRVDPGNLRRALDGAREMGFAGVNLTVPHKILALEMVDEADAEARALGAVNTIRFETNGRLCGFNTDGYGFTQAIAEEFGCAVAGLRVLVLGAGGAGRALALTCRRAGAARVVVANRTVARLADLPGCEGIALADAPGILREVDLIVNATSVGLRPGESLGIQPGRQHLVYDTIYNPPQTELLRVARAAGARTANGLGMLLHQGARAFELWTGRAAPVEVMRAALRRAVAE